MPKKHDHIHKYKRYTYKSTGHQIYRCTIIGCTHFLNAVLLPGRLSICWRCEGQFVVKNTLLAKPHCDACTNKDVKGGRIKESKVGNIDVDKLTELLIG